MTMSQQFFVQAMPLHFLRNDALFVVRQVPVDFLHLADQLCENVGNILQKTKNGYGVHFINCFAPFTELLHLLYVAVSQKIHQTVMSIYSDKLAHVQVVINCQYLCLY